MSLLNEFQKLAQSEWQQMKPGLERMQTACKALGHPEQKFPSIHIAGTNGKGSVAAMLHSVFSKAGYKVGLFTSPHLMRINERFRIGDQEITDEELKKILKNISEFKQLTFFETCTLIAFTYFAQKKVDLAILEVGLGGRLDATNVVTPLVSVITEISLDHTQILGNTMEAIAKEKAGIIKPHIPVVCGATDLSAKKVIEDVGALLAAPLHFVDSDQGAASSAPTFPYELGLEGEYQKQNAKIVLKTLQALHEKVGATGRSPLQVDEQAIRDGLKKVRWPGRMEWLSHNPPILLDGAHNPAGIQALVSSLQILSNPSLILPLSSRGGREGFGYSKKWKILFSAAQDKNVEEMLKILKPIASEIVICRMESSRSVDPLSLLRKQEPSGVSVSNHDSFTTFQILSQNLKPDEGLLVTGSLYLVGEIKRNWLRNKKGLV